MREVEREDQATAFGWIDDIVVNLRAEGLLNDASYAAAKAAQGRAWAKSPAKIKARLRAKGIDAALADQVTRDDGSAEWVAALALARRRRLGPFRDGSRDPASEKRDLGVLARAGISFAVAKRVLTLDSPS